MANLSLLEEMMSSAGREFARILKIRRHPDRKQRWETDWGNKTNLELYIMIAQMVDDTREMFPEPEYLEQISIVWTAEDVRKAGEKLNVSLTRRQVSDVLRSLRRDYDPTSGICFITVECAIKEILSNKKDKEEGESDEQIRQ